MADTGWRDQSPTRSSAAQKYKQLRERGAFGRGNMRYHFVSAVSSAAMAAAAMTFATSAFAQDGDAGSMATGQPLALQGAALDDIVGTARRRDERLQDVPVSVVAFSGEFLEDRGVRELTDLPAIVPGFRFSYEGSKNYTVVSLRGIGQIPVGEGTPGVVTYFANVRSAERRVGKECVSKFRFRWSP